MISLGSRVQVLHVWKLELGIYVTRGSMGNIILGIHSRFSEARILDEEEPVRLFPPCVDGVPESRESSAAREGSILTRN